MKFRPGARLRSTTYSPAVYEYRPEKDQDYPWVRVNPPSYLKSFAYSDEDIQLRYSVGELVVERV